MNCRMLSGISDKGIASGLRTVRSEHGTQPLVAGRGKSGLGGEKVTVPLVAGRDKPGLGGEKLTDCGCLGLMG